MIEVCKYYELKDNIDEQAFMKFSQDLAEMLQKAEGFLSMHVFQAVAGPRTRWKNIATWKSLSAWAALAEDRKYIRLMKRADTFWTKLRIEVWMEGSPIAG